MFFFEYGDGRGFNACYVTGWSKVTLLESGGFRYRIRMADDSEHTLTPDEFAAFRDQLQPLMLDGYKPDVVA